MAFLHHLPGVGHLMHAAAQQIHEVVLSEPATELSFYHVYGLFIARWNGLEGAFKILLHICSGGGAASEILIEQMTNRERASALRVMIRHHERSYLEPAVTHAVLYFDRLEQYRNYYVHEVMASGTMDAETGRYAAFSWTSKLHRDGITNRYAIVKVEDIESLSIHCITAGKFISEVVRHLMDMPKEWSPEPLEPLPDLPATFILPYQKPHARDGA